jgi:Uma2 family endonuclease
MTPVKTDLSWQEFEQLPDNGMHYELFDGELIALPPGT